MIGQTISHYRIVEKLGSGGMGDVYKAKDTRLHRFVALKFLPDDLGHDPKFLARFRREAQAASALNHPHICTIHDIGQVGDRYFIAMELIEGCTLKDFITNNPLDIFRTLELALQLVDALDASHSKGIIHRDVKPGNLFVTSRGQMKILDFGLAKIVGAEGCDSDDPQATLLSEITTKGGIFGTVAYMSPEQVRGDPVDARTDLFSTGVVLYEMSTGKRPFTGATTGAIFDAILHNAPTSAVRLNPDMPPLLEEIINRALEKDREGRYQTASEIRRDLLKLKQRMEAAHFKKVSGIVPPADERAPLTITEQPSPRSGSTVSVSAPAREQEKLDARFTLLTAVSRLRKGVAKQIGLTLLAVLLVALFLGLYEWVRSNQFPTVGSSGRSLTIVRLTNDGKSSGAAISPDGKYVAYVHQDGNLESLWVRHVATANDVQIVAPRDRVYSGLTFSPDGDYLYFARAPRQSYEHRVSFFLEPDASLCVVPTLGGTPRELIPDILAPFTLSPDGKQLSFVRNGLKLANSNGTGIRNLINGDSDPTRPAWSPDDKTIAFASGLGSASIETISIASVLGAQLGSDLNDPVGSKEKRLSHTFPSSEAEEGKRYWSNLGRLQWLADGTGLIFDGSEKTSDYGSQLWLISYPKGEVKRLTNDLNDYRDVSIATYKNALVTTQQQVLYSAWILPDGDVSRGRQIASASGSMGALKDLAWANDGRLIFVSNSGTNEDIWGMNADGSERRQLTVDSGNNWSPSLSADGQTVAFLSDRSGVSNTIWLMDMDDRNPKQITQVGGVERVSISPNGKWIVYGGPLLSPIFKTSTNGGTPVSLMAPCSEPKISPDASMILCVSPWIEREKPTTQVLDASGKLIKSFDVSSSVTWGPDSHSIMYVDISGGISNLWKQPLSGGRPEQVTRFTSDRIYSYAWSRDGKQLAVVRGAVTNDVVLISNIQ